MGATPAPLTVSGRRRPGPRPRLTRDAVIAAAIEIGLDQVTMQGVADRLDTSASALYRYVAGRRELALAAAEALLVGLPLPTMEAGWRGFLVAEAESRWTMLTGHRGLLELGIDTGWLASVTTRRIVSLVEALHTVGFSHDDAVLAVDAVLDLVHDGAAQAGRLHLTTTSDRHQPVIAPDLADRLALCPPEVQDALLRIIDDPKAHVDRKLSLLLDGLETRLQRQESAP